MACHYNVEKSDLCWEIRFRHDDTPTTFYNRLNAHCNGTPTMFLNGRNAHNLSLLLV